jgi:serine phosphatase RsbU (regulator of sigma subunit)
MILPSADELKSITDLDIAGYMEPADDVGGDYYDVLQREGMVAISIGDVTGHGLESGLLMLMTQTAVRALLKSGETDPVRFLDTLNRTIYDNVQRMDSDKNLTLCLLDYQSGTLKLSGQHEEMIVVRRDGTVELIDTIDLGFPIGLDDDIAAFIDQATVQLHSGDGVVLYTDGITEAENESQEQYGLERLCEVVSQHWWQSADDIKDAVIADVLKHIGEQEVYDDITLVVLKQK